MVFLLMYASAVPSLDCLSDYVIMKNSVLNLGIVSAYPRVLCQWANRTLQSNLKISWRMCLASDGCYVFVHAHETAPGKQNSLTYTIFWECFASFSNWWTVIQDYVVLEVKPIGMF